MEAVRLLNGTHGFRQIVLLGGTAIIPGLDAVDGMRKPAPRRDALSSQYAVEVQKETGHEEE